MSRCPGLGGAVQMKVTAGDVIFAGARSIRSWGTKCSCVIECPHKDRRGLAATKGAKPRGGATLMGK